MGNFRKLIVLIIVVAATNVNAQQETDATSIQDFNVKKHTVMEKFEPDYVVSVAERKRMKLERQEIFTHRKSILDTLSISDRRRERLFRELNKNPFSDKVNKKFAEIEFEDEKEVAVSQNK